MRKKKIMHIVEGFGGGVYSFLVDLCNNSTEKYDVILVYSKRPQTPEDFKKDFKAEVKLIQLNMNRNISLINDTKNLFEIIKIIKSNKPDIVHLHSSKAGVLGRVAGRFLGYNKENLFYNPHGYSFLQQNVSSRKKYLYFIIEKFMSKVCGTVISVSKGEHEETLKFTKNAKRVDNAINEKAIKGHIKENTRLGENMVIGTIGRICFQKNPTLFNDIAAYFNDIKFIWIGDGELREEITSKNIEVTGWCKREEVIEKLNEIDLYIQTSLWEGLPIALLEAMYMGKVPIVTNVIGNKDVIVNGENGFLVDDIEGFKNSVNYMLKNPDKYKNMSRNATYFIENNHLLSNMINGYYEIYDMVPLYEKIISNN
ncbi:TPA: glycosyltransferase [Clostridium perfringens]|uniref:glycosyltransferase n=1 Tax=Clostridium perfringens TaxID=1502 RepID=UPI000705FB70|nr:glycosyltransferase [Clostridium perfringens]ALG47874.1 Poly(glycerol-phosphate) alpha-glucosyltransferase [Clostridium perfringens]ELC8368255.1 glycosyltransferase [Clostridium perfringens]ELC8420201.1 glycosyltransferase [Clostridium perfringens]MBO3343895.1 glycosyltransferase [Clostridium perfringens]MBO3347393.1 glycosyltransferase [Clostridium perfringens]